MLAWGKTSDKTQKTGRELISPLPKVKKKEKKSEERLDLTKSSVLNKWQLSYAQQR